MVAEFVALGAFLLSAFAEWLHTRRIRKLAALAFGPANRPRRLARGAPVGRILAVTALAWGLTSLLIVKPKSYRPEGQVQPGKEQHLLIVLDVSPSMRLEDAGPSGKQTRKDRGRDLMRSFFDRVPTEQYLVTVIAVYNGAKPVVVDSSDLNVVDAVLGDLPLYQAFDSGETRLLDGLREAAEVAKPWNPRSASVILLTDGDTVPPQGMPKMPAAVGNVLVVGVGDPVQGTFIAGKQSKQDVFTLRQIASRLSGEYHDGNKQHLPSGLISAIVQRGEANQQEPWSRREYALIAIALGSALLALIPWLLENYGTAYMPGVRTVDDPHRAAA